jgi:hypothetical protein
MEWKLSDLPCDVCDMLGGNIQEIIHKTIAADWGRVPWRALVVERPAGNEHTVGAFARAVPILEAGEHGDPAREEFAFVFVDLQSDIPQSGFHCGPCMKSGMPWDHN